MQGLWKQALGVTAEKYNIKRNHAAIKHFPCSLTIGETSNVNTTQQHNCYTKTYGQGRLCLISDCQSLTNWVERMRRTFLVLLISHKKKITEGRRTVRSEARRVG